MKQYAKELSLTRDPVRSTLFLMMFFTVSRGHEYLGLSPMRPGLTLAAFATVYMFLNPASTSLRSFRSWNAWLVVGMAVVTLASLPFGLSPEGSAAYFLEEFSKVLIFAILLLLTTRGIREVVLWMVSYVLACALLVWMALTVFDLSTAGSQVARLGNMFGYDANDAGLVLVVGIPMCLYLIQTGRPLMRFVAAATLLGCGWAIALTGSRGAFVALAVVGVATLLTLDRISVVKRLGFLAVVTGVLTVAAPSGYWNQMSTILEPTDDYNWSSQTGRKAIAIRAFGYIREYPISGVGLNNFTRAEGTISPLARNAPQGLGVPWIAPHNTYLQVAAELGIPGALVFGGLVFGGMFGMFRLSLRVPKSWARSETPEQRSVALASRYLSLSYLGFMVAAIFLSFAYLDIIYILAAMAAGIHVEARRQRRASVPEPGKIPEAGADEVDARRVIGMRGGLAWEGEDESVALGADDGSADNSDAKVLVGP